MASARRNGGWHVNGLVGREEELSLLHTAIASVAGGDSNAVVLSGPPGAGKTALAGAGLALAAAAGFAVFRGRARPLSRQAAYAPLMDAFGPPLRALPAAARTAVLGEANALALLFNDLGIAAPPPLGDPDLERSRLSDCFVRLAERLAAARPLALLVDDTSLADDATASVLVQLAAGAADVPTLLLLTTRGEPPTDRMDELTSAIAGVGVRMREWELTPLSDADAAELARSVLGAHASDDLVARIVARCGGRPLLIDATARTISELGGIAEADSLPIPDELMAVLRGRIGSCSPDERAVVDVLAVAGDAVGFAVLARAADLDEATTASALESLERRGLAAPVAGIGLAHDLLREVAAAQLTAVGTQRLHARLVAALEIWAPDDPRIAEHALGAGPLLAPDRALELLVRGGERARDLGMNEAAARYLRAAAELAETRVGDEQRADVLALLADSQRRLGRPDDARRIWTTAVDCYTRAGHSEGVARIEQELGMLDWAGGDLDAANRHFQAAEAALDGLEPSPAHAALLYTRAITASRVGDAGVVSRNARELRRLAAELGSPDLEARALLADSVMDYAATDYLEMLRKNRLALEAAERSGNPLLVIRAHDQISVAAASQLDLPLLRAHSRTSLQLATELGATSLQGWPRGRLATADLLAGDWEGALRATADLLRLSRRLGEQRGSVSTAAGHAWVLVRRGRLAEARAVLDEARQLANPMLQPDRNIFSIVAIAAICLELANDDPASAVEVGAQLDNTTGGWLPQLGLAWLGEAHARAGATEAARRIVGRLGQIRSSSTCAPQTLAHWVAGRVAERDEPAGAAAEHFRAAAEGFESLGLSFHSARMRLAAAEAEADAQPQSATELAHTALETFDRLGAAIEAQHGRALLRSLGVVPSRGRRRRATGSVHSARELEVARGVAAGLSNAEVAEALFVSPRTVTTHLSRIYTRLGLGSRAALTRYLADAGLLEPPAASGATPDPHP